MNRRLFRGIILMFLLGLALAFFAKVARAESSAGVSSTTARLTISITVMPTFRILESTPVEGGQQLRVFTNMRDTYINGKYVQFSRVGEQTVFVPGTSTLTTDGLGVVTYAQP